MIKSYGCERKNLDTIVVTWDVDVNYPNMLYTVERCINNTGIGKIATETKSKTYVDTDCPYDSHQEYSYRIVCDKFISPWFSRSLVGDPYLWEMAGAVLWGIKEARMGTKAYAFTQDTTDDGCPECWDKILHKRIKSHCSICNGSGKISGYYGPTETWLKTKNTSPKEEYYGDVMMNIQTINALAPNFPHLKKTDIVVLQDNNRYVVDENPTYGYLNTDTGEKFLYKQNIVLRLLERKDPAYRIEI